eukprot:m.609939 g.609939  ORF g.609939 m.609939 type:complete len:763 (+) comp22493_c0_seq2:199-2487(+)
MSKKGKGNSEWECEDILQAVLLADSFNQRFAPLTFDQPRCLLPLANMPLIDYTLEMLCTSGVQEILVVCRSFAEEIKAHLKQAGWEQNKSVKIITRVSKAFSLGECLREVDTMDIIKKDFILVSGDIVSNIVLTAALEEHKARFKRNKNALMTMLFKVTGPGHHIRSPEDDISIAIGRDNRVAAYVHNDDNQFAFSSSIFASSTNVDMRYDLMDCHISLCSPEVLMRFTDEFDYQTMADFIEGIHEDEVRLNTIHAYIVNENEYVARVGNLHQYNAVSKDVLGRWCYPLVPELIHGQRGMAVQNRRHNIYLEEGAVLTRGCMLEENVLMGKNSRVGREGAPITVISNCVIGRNCTIGAGVRITNSYIFDDVTIEDDCTIDCSIIAAGVVIKSEVRLHPGVMLGYGVTVGPRIALAENTRVSLRLLSREEESLFATENTDPGADERFPGAGRVLGRAADDSSEESGDSDEGSDDGGDNNFDDATPTRSTSSAIRRSDGVWNVSQVGSQGKGYLYCPEDDEESDEDSEDEDTATASRAPAPTGPHGTWWKPLTAEILDDEESSSEDEDEDKDGVADMAGLDDYDDDDRDGVEDEAFQDEVVDLVQERVMSFFNAGTANKVPMDNLALEIAASRSAHNKTPDQVVRGLVFAIMTCNNVDGSVKERVNRIKRIFLKVLPIFKKYIIAPPDKLKFIFAIEEACIKCTYTMPAFQTVIHALYEADALPEQTVLGWHRAAGNAAIRTQVEPFVAWLQDAEEESDEDDSD